MKGSWGAMIVKKQATTIFQPQSLGKFRLVKKQVKQERMQFGITGEFPINILVVQGAPLRSL